MDKRIAKRAVQMLEAEIALFKQYRWIQGSAAVNRRNLAVSPRSSTAVGFCLIGGLSRVCGKGGPALRVARRYLSEACSSGDAYSVIDYNDNFAQSKRHVVAKIRAAIRLIEQEVKS